MTIRVTANVLRNIIRSVILEESQRRNSQRRLQESRRRAYRLYEGFKNNFEDNLNNYNPDAKELADIDAARLRQVHDERIARRRALAAATQPSFNYNPNAPENFISDPDAARLRQVHDERIARKRAVLAQLAATQSSSPGDDDWYPSVDDEELEASEKAAALSQFKKPAQKKLSYTDWSPFNYESSEYMNNYEYEFGGDMPRGDKNAVGSVAKLYDLIMNINSVESFEQIQDFEVFEPMVMRCYDEINYLIRSSSPAIDQVMSDVSAMADRMNALQEELGGFDDGDISDQVASVVRLYEFYNGVDW